jgi:hypothetical protein
MWIRRKFCREKSYSKNFSRHSVQTWLKIIKTHWKKSNSIREQFQTFLGCVIFNFIVMTEIICLHISLSVPVALFIYIDCVFRAWSSIIAGWLNTWDLCKTAAQNAFILFFCQLPIVWNPIQFIGSWYRDKILASTSKNTKNFLIDDKANRRVGAN